MTLYVMMYSNMPGSNPRLSARARRTELRGAAMAPRRPCLAISGEARRGPGEQLLRAGQRRGARGLRGEKRAGLVWRESDFRLLSLQPKHTGYSF